MDVISWLVTTPAPCFPAYLLLCTLPSQSWTLTLRNNDPQTTRFLTEVVLIVAFCHGSRKKLRHVVWAVPVLYYCGWFILKECKFVMRTKCRAKGGITVTIRVQQELRWAWGNTKEKWLLSKPGYLVKCLLSFMYQRKRREWSKYLVCCKSGLEKVCSIV